MSQRILQALRVVALFFLLQGITASTSVAWAQSAGATSSAITGTIRDAQGAILSGAIISAKNLATGTIREATTDDIGGFVIPQLSPGDYEVTISAPGFQTQVERTTLTVGSTAFYNPKLPVSANNEVVEVTAQSSVDVTKTDSSTNVTDDRIRDLPINRRTFLDFSQTAARVNADRIPAQGAAATSGLSFNGQSARFNNVTIDGVDNNEIASGSVRTSFSQDAVQEFQVVSDSYSAEFGRALGGIVNIVTRGGGNDFHGTSFFFTRTDETSARDVFSNIEPNFEQYQFGATLSGPIKKDKAFFFTSFERLSIDQSRIITISDATIAAARRQGFSVVNGPVPVSTGNTNLLARLDYKITPSDQLFVRYNFGGRFDGAFEGFGGLTGQTSAGIQELDDNALVVSNVYTNAGLNLVNETRFLYSQREQDITQASNEPLFQIFAPEGLVMFGRGTFLPQFRKARYYQFVNNTTLVRGRHQIRFGVDGLFQTDPDRRTNLPIFPGGVAVFTPIDFGAAFGLPGQLPVLTAGQAFDPQSRDPIQRIFLQGLSLGLPAMIPGFPMLPLADLPLPSAFTQGFGNVTLGGSSKLYAGFIQDDFKIKPNLLIKAGIRYDINRIAFSPPNDGNFAPRVGFSYQPGFLPKLNVRASYGLFFALQPIGPAAGAALSSSGRLRLPATVFPFSVIPLTLPDRRFPEGDNVPPLLSAISVPQLELGLGIQKDLRNTYAQEGNFGLDYFLTPGTTISATYNVVRGTKILGVRNINPIANPVFGNPLANAMFGRPDPTRGDFFEFESAFDSYFHGATFTFNSRLNRRFNVLASFTVAKAIDNFIDLRIESGLSESNDPLNPRGERGLSVQDVRKRLVVSGTWDLDYTKNIFLRDFQISSIINLSDGRPFNLIAGVDLNQNGDNPPGDRPAGLGRNVGIGPGFANVDFRVTRRFVVKENIQFSAFAEFFNLFNRVNISDFNRVFLPNAQGGFNLPQQDNGRFTVSNDRFRNAFSPRQIQFGFRFSF